MKRIKLFLYPNARRHTHDDIDNYRGTTPMCESGIAAHCELVPPEHAEYFYMGQIGDDPNRPPLEQSNFPFITAIPEKHIYDFEGDHNCDPSDFLEKCIFTANGAPYHWRNRKLVVRPTFSTVLVHLARQEKLQDFPLPNKKSFGFRGLPDPFGVRIKTYRAICEARLPGEIQFTNNWNGPVDINDLAVELYQKNLLESTFAICPRGNGRDSARIYEAMAYGRVPVLVGDHILLNEEDFDVDTSFCCKISQYCTMQQMSQQLTQIYQMPYSEMADRAWVARNYFETVVQKYFRDPTAYFLEKLEQNKW